MSVSDYAEDFRGHPACPCQVAWLPVFEAEAQRLGYLTGALSIAQLIGGAAASGGTHATGGAADFWPGGSHVSDMVALARDMGADATWHRTPAQGFSEHVHSVLRGCPHNSPARYQITAVDNGGNGLGAGGMGGSDDGPRPLSGRTWREGIKWAKDRQREAWDDMASKDDLRQVLAHDVVAPLRDTIRKYAAAERERTVALAKALDAGLASLGETVADDASRAQVKNLRALVKGLPTTDESEA